MDNFYYYTIKQNEYWTGISKMAYGSPNKVADILKANPDIAIDVFAPEGVEIKIPILETVAVTLSSEILPIWKQ